MKHLFAAFLIILTPLPGLVCAMPLQHVDLSAYKAGERSHCEQVAVEHSGHVQDPASIMLYADCTGVDLFTPVDLPKLTESVLDLDIDWDHVRCTQRYQLSSSVGHDTIRGSPLAATSSTPVYLATHRIRI